MYRERPHEAGVILIDARIVRVIGRVNKLRAVGEKESGDFDDIKPPAARSTQTRVGESTCA